MSTTNRTAERKPVVIVGLGQLGAVFAHGLLRTGWPLYPVNRGDDLGALSRDVPDPAMVLVTVGEADLAPVLAALPDLYRDRVTLVQNELFEPDWRAHGIEEPTVVSVWFEKKKSKPLNEIVESPVAGPAALLIGEALGSLGLTATPIQRSALPFELARKTVYILTANIAGLETEGTVGELFGAHRSLAERIADEAMDICEHRAGQTFDRGLLLEAVRVAVDADPDHGARGRSAHDRLRRCIALGNEADLALPKMRELAAKHLVW